MKKINLLMIIIALEIRTYFRGIIFLFLLFCLFLKIGIKKYK